MATLLSFCTLDSYYTAVNGALIIMKNTATRKDLLWTYIYRNSSRIHVGENH